MGKKNKYAAQIAPERVDELVSALREGAWPGASNGEVQAVVARLADAEDADALASLHDAVDAKPQAKAVKGALFKLSQRGVEVPELEKPSGIQIAPEVGELPFLLAPPGRDAVRRITFAVRREGTVHIVEAVFRANTGLFRLVTQPSTGRAFQQFATRMVAEGQRVRVPGLVERKMWEIGQHLQADACGPEVDRSVAELLTIPKRRPSHPVFSLPLARGRSLELAEMVEEDERVRPFYHSGAIERMRAQWHEVGGSAHIAPSAEVRAERQTELQRWTVDLCKQWGWTGVIETVLDNASYLAAIGDEDGAVTLRALAAEEQLRDTQVAHFIASYLGWVLGN